jgi:hypothetical protein
MPEEIRMRPVTEVIKAGEGAQGTALSIHQGQVILHFQKPCEWASFDPETARRLAEQMSRFAYEAHHGRAPSDAENQSFLAQGMRRKITKVLREKMVNRTVMLLRNFIEKKPALGYQAEQIVDHVLKEIA